MPSTSNSASASAAGNGGDDDAAFASSSSSSTASSARAPPRSIDDQHQSLPRRQSHNDEAEFDAALADDDGAQVPLQLPLASAASAAPATSSARVDANASASARAGGNASDPHSAGASGNSSARASGSTSASGSSNSNSKAAANANGKRDAVLADLAARKAASAAHAAEHGSSTEPHTGGNQAAHCHGDDNANASAGNGNDHDNGQEGSSDDAQAETETDLWPQIEVHLRSGDASAALAIVVESASLRPVRQLLTRAKAARICPRLGAGEMFALAARVAECLHPAMDPASPTNSAGGNTSSASGNSNASGTDADRDPQRVCAAAVAWLSHLLEWHRQQCDAYARVQADGDSDASGPSSERARLAAAARAGPPPGLRAAALEALFASVHARSEVGDGESGAVGAELRPQWMKVARQLARAFQQATAGGGE
jgi:hypothetical protein